MREKYRVTLMGSMGAGLEYYDFVIYGLLLSYLNPHFFKAEQGGFARILVIFALGYLARPLGGVIFGVVADRIGRKTSFVVAMFMMAFSTFLIGLLPTAAQLGSLAPILLGILRFMQGIAFGAEMPGTITIISEYNQKNTGYHLGFVLSSAGVGTVLASGVMVILSCLLEPRQMASWGWRIPFILGGILAVIACLIRSSLGETPAFRVLGGKVGGATFSPLRLLFSQYRMNIFSCFLVNLVPSLLIVMNLYCCTFLRLFFDYSSNLIFQSMMIGILVTAPALPFLGRLSDRYTPERIFSLSLMMFIVLGYFGFHLLYMNTFFALAGFFVIQQLFICVGVSSAIPLTARYFPTVVRFTGIGFCYNLAYVTASLYPLLLDGVLGVYPDIMVAFYIPAVIAIVVMVLLPVLARKLRTT